MNEKLYKAMGFHVQAPGVASLRVRIDNAVLSRLLPAGQRGLRQIDIGFQ